MTAVARQTAPLGYRTRVRVLCAMRISRVEKAITNPIHACAGNCRGITGFLRTGLVLFALALSTSGAFAQVGTTGNVEGYVIEEGTQNPLPGANVVIDGTTQGAATNQEGYYIIEGVASGTHLLVVSSLGYRTLAHQGFYDGWRIHG